MCEVSLYKNKIHPLTNYTMTTLKKRSRDEAAMAQAWKDLIQAIKPEKQALFSSEEKQTRIKNTNYPPLIKTNELCYWELFE